MHDYSRDIMLATSQEQIELRVSFIIIFIPYMLYATNIVVKKRTLNDLSFPIYCSLWQVSTSADKYQSKLPTSGLMQKPSKFFEIWNKVKLGKSFRGQFFSQIFCILMMKSCIKKNIFFCFLFLLFFLYFCILLPLPPLRGQPAVIMPTLLAPQQGMTCPFRLERCRIRTRDCRFYSLVHYQWATKSPISLWFSP